MIKGIIAKRAGTIRANALPKAVIPFANFLLLKPKD
jgi:hypothetical protein